MIYHASQRIQSKPATSQIKWDSAPWQEHRQKFHLRNNDWTTIIVLLTVHEIHILVSATSVLVVGVTFSHYYSVPNSANKRLKNNKMKTDTQKEIGIWISLSCCQPGGDSRDTALFRFLPAHLCPFLLPGRTIQRMCSASKSICKWRTQERNADFLFLLRFILWASVP